MILLDFPAPFLSEFLETLVSRLLKLHLSPGPTYTLLPPMPFPLLSGLPEQWPVNELVTALCSGDVFLEVSDPGQNLHPPSLTV